MHIMIEIPEQMLDRDMINITAFLIDEKITDVNVEDKDVDFTVLSRGHGRLFAEKDIVNGNYEIIGNRIYELEPVIESDRGVGEPI